MGVGAGVENQAGGFLAGFLYPVDQIALVVRLAEFDPDAKFRGEGAAVRFDPGQVRPAIDARLALAELVLVGAVENDPFF